ncbi:alpha/beta hydrolase [Actinoplanes sp. NPDC051633]|uniref:alpha/beta fold hydrolase n=1 Tax=Actinoplanes sp. NPDC051633 TaxID=3155670 RepID=UPI00343D3D5D
MEMIPADDGVRLRTWTAGTATGRPSVLLLHGGPGLWDYLGPVSRMLEPLTVVHRFDQRGCGGSDPSDEHTTARYVADIEALRRHWNVESWTVAGHSFGSELALSYAIVHPARTAALLYLNGVGIGDWRAAYRAEIARRMTPAQRDRLAGLSARTHRTHDEELEFRTLAWFTDHADPHRGWAWAAADAAVDLPINFTANRRLADERRARDEAAHVAAARRLTMPCHFVHGAADPRPSAAVAELAAAIPTAELHILEGAGHQPWREHPERFAALLRKIVAGRRPRRLPHPGTGWARD